MKNRIMKMFFIFILVIMFSFSVCFADADSPSEESVFTSILTDIVHYISWFSIIIAFGFLIFIGIKYVMSGASQKANLKSIFPVFFLGLIIIIFSLTIAKFVSDIAGNDPAEDIVDVGIKAGDSMSIQTKTQTQDDYNAESHGGPGIGGNDRSDYEY